ncbi:MAG: 23S rRNA (uracil(1939)-C(5))-methyltransferase RlmD [Planctomycetota bacterium]
MRRPPICPLFGDCGGCSVFERDYGAELDARLARAAAALAAEGPPDLPPLALLHERAGRAPRHYRTRLLWPVQAGPRGRLRAGLYRSGTHELVEIERCETQDPDLTALAHATLALAEEHGLEARDERTGAGFLRAVDLRVMPATGQALVGLVTAGGVWDEGPAFARELRRGVARLERRGGRRPFTVEGVLRNLNDDRGNRVLGPAWLPLAGRAYQDDRAADLVLRVSAGSFYQSNGHADRLLYRPVLAALGGLEGQRVVDAYGGVGCFALRLARAGAASVTLVESHAGAVRDAGGNVTRNGLEQRVEVRAGRVAEVLGTLEPGPDLCLLDPPRAGLMAEGRDALLSLRPARIAYVSCHAPSLARDLGPLVQGGYRVTTLAAADLFPRTSHVEVVAVLARLP